MSHLSSKVMSTVSTVACCALLFSLGLFALLATLVFFFTGELFDGDSVEDSVSSGSLRFSLLVEAKAEGFFSPGDFLTRKFIMVAVRDV